MRRIILNLYRILIAYVPFPVIIDRRNDPKADTGGFELIYKQVIPPSPAYMGLNLSLKGQQISQKSSGAGGGGGVKRDKFSGRDQQQQQENGNNRSNNLKQIVSRNISSGIVGRSSASKSMVERQRRGPVIMDLIECLDVKQTKRQMSSGRGQAMMASTRNSPGYLKCKNKVDVDYREKNQSSVRRHQSCGPILGQQSTMKTTPRIEAMEEPLIVPVATISTQQVAKIEGESDYLRSDTGNREDVILLPPVNNAGRKLGGCDSVGQRVLGMSPKTK